MQTVETLNEGLKRAYTLTITRADIDKRVDREVVKMAPRMRMPGFRPGKVPANLVRKMHGASLQQEALNGSIQDGVQKLLADNKLRPAMQPAVELDQGYAPGKDAEVKVTLEVLPEVPVPAIEGLKLERLTIPVDDAAIDEAVDKIASQNKLFEAAAKPTYKAQAGDQVVMDFEGKVDGVPFDGGKGEGMSVEIGSGQLIPGFEDQLIGVKANDQKTISVTFPADYTAKELAGKSATFDLVINEVKTPKSGIADDEFAKSLGLEGLQQLRDLLKGQIEQEYNGLTRTHMKRRLLDQLAASHDFEVPPSMVDAEFEQIWKQLEHEASHEADPAAARAEMEAERADYRRIAERRVRLGLLLSEIGQKNGVEVNQQEMNRLIAQAAQQYNAADRERFIEYVRQDAMAAAQLRAPVYEDKVVDLLFAKAEVSERQVTRAEIEAEIESEEDGHVHGPGCGHDHGEDVKPAAKAKGKKTATKPVAAGEGAVEAPAPVEVAAAEAAPVKAKGKKAAVQPEIAAEAPTVSTEKPARKTKAKNA